MSLEAEALIRAGLAQGLTLQQLARALDSISLTQQSAEEDASR